MNITIFGAGGVGGYFGGKLALAYENHDKISVSFVARGDHGQAIADQGLTLVTPEGTSICRPAKVSENPADLPQAGLVLLCVKGYGLKEALQKLKGAVNDRCVILPLLNGVDISSRIREEIPWGMVLPSCVYVGTHISSPGVVTQNGGAARILTGPDQSVPGYSATEVLEVLKQAGISAEWLSDPSPAIWGKFMFIAAYGLVTASTGQSLDQVCQNSRLKTKVRHIMEEIYHLGKAEKINLPQNIVSTSLEKALTFPPGTKTSFQRDVEVPDKPHEGDLFGGTILRLAKKHGAAVPVTEDVLKTIRKP